jgi:hypothetical protein
LRHRQPRASPRFVANISFASTRIC